MSATNNIIFKNYPEADKYRKHLSIEEKAKLFDIICNILPCEHEAYDYVWEKYGKKWSDDLSKGIDSNRIHAFYQLQAILHSALKPDVSEMCIYGDNGDIYAPSYRSVDVDLTLDKLCNFLSDTFGTKFIWGRDVLADRGREVEFFIRCEDDSDVSFMAYGEEFTPLYDDWWELLNSLIPKHMLDKNIIELWSNGVVVKSAPNPFKNVTCAKELFDKLVEWGY